MREQIINSNFLQNPRCLWLAWERHRRTLELSDFFQINLWIFDSNAPRIIKHPYFILKTFLLLLIKRPKILFIQCPSVFLGLCCVILKKIINYKLIVDAHNACLTENRWLPTGLIYLIHKKANVTIVTNDKMADAVRSFGGTPLILPDRIPTPNISEKKESPRKFRIVYICSFASDEPYNIFFEAIKKLESNSIEVFVTGKANRKLRMHHKVIKNLVFTGFLPEREYWALLASANLIVDLTSRDDCLVCGAYEAVALEVPILLSDTETLREHFFRGSLFCQNTPESVKKNIEHSIEKYEWLKKEIACLKQELEARWLKRVEQFLHELSLKNK